MMLGGACLPGCLPDWEASQEWQARGDAPLSHARDPVVLQPMTSGNMTDSI